MDVTCKGALVVKTCKGALEEKKIYKVDLDAKRIRAALGGRNFKADLDAKMTKVALVERKICRVVSDEISKGGLVVIPCRVDLDVKRIRVALDVKNCKADSDARKTKVALDAKRTCKAVLDAISKGALDEKIYKADLDAWRMTRVDLDAKRRCRDALVAVMKLQMRNRDVLVARTKVMIFWKNSTKNWMIKRNPKRTNVMARAA